MAPEARSHVVQALAAVFQLHHLRVHLDELRKVWRQQPGCWPDDFVEHWAGMLRLPGYENVLEVHDRGAPCSRCSGQFLRTGCNFPGGWTIVCGDCQHEWIVLERVSA